MAFANWSQREKISFFLKNKQKSRIAQSHILLSSIRFYMGPQT